jgi:hypothetical protein
MEAQRHWRRYYRLASTLLCASRLSCALELVTVIPDVATPQGANSWARGQVRDMYQRHCCTQLETSQILAGPYRSELPVEMVMGRGIGTSMACPGCSRINYSPLRLH